MNKFQKIISIIFNLNDQDINKKSYNACIEEKSIESNKPIIKLDDDKKYKLKKLILHLARQKRKIGFHMREEHIEIYFDENNFKNNTTNSGNSGNIYASPSNYGSVTKTFNLFMNSKSISINSYFFVNDGFYEEISEILKVKMIEIENILVDETIEDMIDVSNFRRNMNLDELLDEPIDNILEPHTEEDL